MLRCSVLDNPKQWEEVLSKMKFAYIAINNHSTCKSPFSIVYSKQPNISLDKTLSPKCTSGDATNFTDSYTEMLVEVH